MSKIKLAGKSISEILKRIKRAQRNKRATQNQEKAGLSVKSVKPWNYRAGARNEQIVPVKKQSQKGSSFQPHRIRGKQGAASIRETSEGSAASWRDEMDKYFGDLTPSKFFKKSSGGDINTGMKKLSPKQKQIAAKAPPPDKIDGKDFAVLKAEKAKGRGMGLQDEKIKPGKVMKAALGALALGMAAKKLKDDDKLMPVGLGAAMLKKKKMAEILGRSKGGESKKVMKARIGKEIKADPTKPISSVKPKLGGGADASRKTFPSMEAMRKAKGFKPGETPSQFNKRRMMLEGAKKAAKATRIGKIAAGIGAVGVAASQFLKKKMEEKKENKKMVGGMAKKYSKGGDSDVVTKKEVKDNYAQAKRDHFKMKRYSKGGGADTGRMGEIKSQFAVASDRLRRKKRDGDRLTQRDIEAATKIARRRSRNEDRITNRDIESASSAIKGYKSGTMVKARGCKLGRTRPTKIT